MFPQGQNLTMLRSTTEYRALRAAIAAYVEMGMLRPYPSKDKRAEAPVDRALDDVICAVRDMIYAVDIATDTPIITTITRLEWELALQRWKLHPITFTEQDDRFVEEEPES